MSKHLMYSLLAMTFAGPALASGHYVLEVWNPPEARGAAAVHTKKAMSAHKSVKWRHVSLYAAASHTRHKPGAAISGQSPAHATTMLAASAAPPFDDIPRQIAPEGNVLRVSGGQERVDVER
ncbi:hypothetical protein [Paraburkholderia terrae]